MNLANLMSRSGRLYPDSPALFLGQERVATYAELARRVACLAAACQSRFGLKPGDRVAIVMNNRPEFVEILYACWHAGLVAVPLNPRLHPRELAYILQHSEARLCFAGADLAETLAPLAAEFPGVERIISIADADYSALMREAPAALVDRRPEDAAWLFYTSGTTGQPKGAELSHRNLLTMSYGYFIDFEPITPGDSILHVGPMCHGSGLYILPHVAAGAAHIIPAAKSFDAAELFDLINFHFGVSFFAAPTIVKRLVEHPAARSVDVSHLRTIAYGGAPMYLEDLKRALTCFGPDKFAQLYGQGESPMAITVLSKAMHADTRHPRYEERLASVGIAQSVVEVRIADAEDRTLRPGETGEVLVRGDTVMNGYIKNPEANRSTLRGGWLHTGDVGVMDEDGFVTLKDRSKDVIISGGSNIYPREVEEVLLQHPGVGEVSVIGHPDPEWGEVAVAFVACAPGAQASAAELDALCLANIARYKRPKSYRFVKALPKSHLGKILKTELREQLKQEATT